MLCPGNLKISTKAFALQSRGNGFCTDATRLNKMTCEIKDCHLLEEMHLVFLLSTLYSLILSRLLWVSLLNALCISQLILCQYHFGMTTVGVCVSIKHTARTCPPLATSPIKWLSAGLQSCFLALH